MPVVAVALSVAGAGAQTQYPRHRAVYRRDAAVLIDVSAFWSVFIAPRQSTAALNLLAAPLWNLFCVAPLALAAEVLLARKK